MKHILLPILTLVTLASAQQPVKLVPYVYSPAAPAGLSGTWAVDPKQSTGLYRSITTPAERVFEATVEYRSATARKEDGDVTIRVSPVSRPNNGTNIYGNLRTRAYWYPGYRCTGEFRMDEKTRQVVEWRGMCGQGRDKQTIPLRLVRGE